MQILSISLLVVVSMFMILLILIQRGKGGGLAGAFGGMGGQSAFGTKAGDMFTKITVITACVWFVLCIGTVWYLKHGMSSRISGFDGGATVSDTPAPTESSAPVATPEPASAPASAETSAPAEKP